MTFRTADEIDLAEYIVAPNKHGADIVNPDGHPILLKTGALSISKVMAPFKTKGKKKLGYTPASTVCINCDDATKEFFTGLTEQLKSVGPLWFKNAEVLSPLKEYEGDFSINCKASVTSVFQDAGGNEVSLDGIGEMCGKFALKISKIYRLLDDEGEEKIGYSCQIDFFKACAPAENQVSKKRKYENPF